MKCVLHKVLCILYGACTIYVGFSGSDSNCKQLLVYCVSVEDASSKMFNSESS